MSVLDNGIEGVSVTSEVDILAMTPISINVPDAITSMSPFIVSWERFENDTGGIVNYRLERKLDSELYCQIYCGKETSYSDTITSNWQNVQYRVCAVSSNGQCSDYIESEFAKITINESKSSTIANLSVGDIIKIPEGDIRSEFIIVHKGIPSDMYDESCDGVWLLRKNTLTTEIAWHGTSQSNYHNNYENSNIKTWLNGTYLNTINEKVRDVIKIVKIPFKKGSGAASTGVYSGSDGLSCKVFALSVYEVGCAYSKAPIDGSRLTYFINDNADELANQKRMCKKDSGVDVNSWWLRTPHTDSIGYAYAVATDMKPVTANGAHYFYPYTKKPVRPAFIVPNDLSLNFDGTLIIGMPPKIIIDKSDNMGELSEGFVINCEITDEEGTALSANASLNGKQFVSVYEDGLCKLTIECMGDDWLKIPLGEHIIDICASNGTTGTHKTITFTRILDKLFIMPKNPIDISDIIRVCSLKIEGSLPEDADLVCEVTNNAKDAEPVWEDCTDRVKANLAYVFKNKTAENGFAFNFRISFIRGESGNGGYITKIYGGVE